MKGETVCKSVVGLGAAALFALGGAGCKKSENAAWKLPLDAKQLPPTTSVIEAEVVEGSLQDDPLVKQEYTAAELASEICREEMPDAARELELMSDLGPAKAKQFFAPANIAQVQQALECGGLLGANMDGQFQTAIEYTDDSAAKAEVDVLTMKTQDLPARYGLTKHAFGAVDGYCRTSDPARPGVTLDCGPKSEAVLHQGSTWFLGTRTELETVAKTLSNPKQDLSTQVAALNDAANQIEGLSSMRIEAQLATSKPFLSAPCGWGALQTAGSITDFVQGCFPSSDDKIISDIDAKLRAAAFEIEPDVQKAGSVHGNIVFVARDDDAGKAVEKDAQDLATDWKAQLENNDAKLVAQAKKNPVSLRQKSWAIIVDNFVRAIEKMKVTRSGRVVKMTFNEPLVDDDRRDLADAKKDTADRRQAVAEVLQAIQNKQPVPVASLTKLVGASWAQYLAADAAWDPHSPPAGCGATPAPSKKGKSKPAPVDPRCVAPVAPPESSFGDGATLSRK